MTVWPRKLGKGVTVSCHLPCEPGIKEPGAKLPARAHTLPGRLEATKPEAGDPEGPFNGCGRGCGLNLEGSYSKERGKILN